MPPKALPLANGIFGADMAVSLINDGPVTIWMDTETLDSVERVFRGAVFYQHIAAFDQRIN